MSAQAQEIARLKAELEAAQARATAAEQVLQSKTRTKIIPGTFTVEVTRPNGQKEKLKLKMREPAPPKIQITKSVSGLQTTFPMLTEDFVALAQNKPKNVRNAQAAALFVENGKVNDLFVRIKTAYAAMFTLDSKYFQIA